MDRQDIDALLIGALYGELTPADEARLTAHLDSHPTDRGALDDLKSARQAVRESRIFELQLEPPQAVSALLLQEAHRRAPKRVAAVQAEEKESWFFRFTKMFLAHPAMAAAAMLVLVVGVAGTLYLRNGDQFADKKASTPAAETTVATESAAPAPAATPTDPSLAPTGAAQGSGQAFDVALADKADEDGNADRRYDTKEAEKAQRDVAKNKKQSTAIVVDTPRPQPKELPERPSRAKVATKGAARGDDFRGNYDTGLIGGTGTATAAPGGGGGAASGRVATTTTPAAPRNEAAVPASPPPPVVAQSQAKPTSPAKTSVAKVEAKPEPAPATDPSLLAWAKSAHGNAVQLAKRGDCQSAAKVVVQISHRAADYYNQVVATDRQLKSCRQYIQQYLAGEREADERAKKRASPDALETK